MIIRWLGAFGKNGSLQDSIQFELNRDSEVAAELLKNKSLISHARIGLLVKNSAVVKKFDGDCWSVREDGGLVKSRNPKTARSQHKEVWAKPNYIGLVVKSRITKSAFKEIKYIASIYNLDLFKFKSGDLKKIN